MSSDTLWRYRYYWMIQASKKLGLDVGLEGRKAVRGGGEGMQPDKVEAMATMPALWVAGAGLWVAGAGLWVAGAAPLVATGQRGAVVGMQ